MSHRIGIASTTLGATALVATLLALPGAGAARAAAEPSAPAESAVTDASKPELDLVVTTGVRFHPDHTRMVQDRLVVFACDCLKGLLSETAGVADRPQDGGAHYRLLIRHAAVIKVQPGTRSDYLLPYKRYYARFVTAEESGGYQFRLMKWNGTAYDKVDQWQTPYGKTHWFITKRGLQYREIEEAKPKLMLQAEPTSVRAALLSHLAPIKMVRSTGTAGKAQTCKVAVANRSPWTLKALDVEMEWPHAHAPRRGRYKTTFHLGEPLAPGEETTVTCTGEPLALHFEYQYEQPMEILPSATWERAKPN